MLTRVGSNPTLGMTLKQIRRKTWSGRRKRTSRRAQRVISLGASVRPFGAPKEQKMKEQKITIKFESNNGRLRTKKTAYDVAQWAKQMQLTGKKNVVFLKKKPRRLLITLISGPHIHKKSREQFSVGRYSGSLVLKMQKSEGRSPKEKAFANLKKKLYKLNMDEGYSVTFTYLRDECVRLDEE